MNNKVMWRNMLLIRSEKQGRTPFSLRLSALNFLLQTVLTEHIKHKGPPGLYLPSEGRSNIGKHTCRDWDSNPHSADQKHPS